MPIYEYVCERCGTHLEVMQKMSDPPLKRCKHCRGKLEKLISQTSFQLKGSGWYVTDYAGKTLSKSEKPESSSSDSSTPASKSETKSSPGEHKK